MRPRYRRPRGAVRRNKKKKENRVGESVGERDREAGRKYTAKPENQGNQRQSLSSSDGGDFLSVGARGGEGEGRKF